MIRKAFFIVTTVILIVALFAGFVSALDATSTRVTKANLDNVGSYLTARHASGINYAIDNGKLFAGRPGEWQEVVTPHNVIAGAIAVDSADPRTVYLGAANEMAIYRSQDRGRNWMRVALSGEYVGGVTSMAVDSAQRVVFVGTDTAGIFRLRDVGSSMIVGGHEVIDDPVQQIVTDGTGAGLTFVRTTRELFQASDGGLQWHKIENLGSSPTALAVSATYPPRVFVGTNDRGLLVSNDGNNWELANDGLGFVPGSRLQVNSLAADPAQLDTIYVATSYLYGTAEYHQSPVGVAMSVDGGGSWRVLAADTQNVVVELAPVAGQTGAVYALTMTSRTPHALGTAETFASAPETAPAGAKGPQSSLAAWLIAALAAIALVFAGMNDVIRRSKRIAGEQPQLRQMQTQTASHR